MKQKAIISEDESFDFYKRASEVNDKRDKGDFCGRLLNKKQDYRPKLTTAIHHDEAKRVLIEKLCRPMAEGCVTECHRVLDEYFDEIHGKRDPWSDSVEDWLKDKDGRLKVNKSTLGWLFANKMGTMREFMKFPPSAIRADCECCGAWDESGLKMARERFEDYMERKHFMEERDLMNQ